MKKKKDYKFTIQKSDNKNKKKNNFNTLDNPG